MTYLSQSLMRSQSPQLVVVVSDPNDHYVTITNYQSTRYQQMYNKDDNHVNWVEIIKYKFGLHNQTSMKHYPYVQKENAMLI